MPSLTTAPAASPAPAQGKLLIDCDFHLHSHYSMGVSKNMTLPVLAEQAARKGIGLVGVSDITHPKWRAHLVEVARAAELLGTAAARAGTAATKAGTTAGKAGVSGSAKAGVTGPGGNGKAGPAPVRSATRAGTAASMASPVAGMAADGPVDGPGGPGGGGGGLVAPGTYRIGPTRFILTGEVEDSRRVHHLLIFPELSSVESFCETVAPASSTLEKDGRPKLRLTGVEVAQAALDVEALIGPAHAFTPWTALYAYHDSLTDCYGDLASKLAFVELGLSAESSYGDRIPELADLTFLTNSDAHSPWPNKFAREFNRLELAEATFEGVRAALLRQKGNRVVLNVGLPPEEGKYNRTACTRCYRHHSFPEAVARQWRCGCGGLIKKGVVDRVGELAALAESRAGKSGRPSPPEHRPPYLHLIPLGELIAKALGVASPNAKKVQNEWEKLVARYGSEIGVAVDAPIDELLELALPPVGQALELFRSGNYTMRPGGGGRFGEVVLPGENQTRSKEAPVAPKESQATLFQFEA